MATQNGNNGNHGGNGNNSVGGNRPELFIDGDPYQWNASTISGAQIRALGKIPQDVIIYQDIPGQPDREILDTTTVNLLEHPGPERFSTQAPGSQAGG